MILEAYLLVNLATSLVLSRKKGIQYFFLLPIIFAVLHFSYGAGFLAGLIKFSGRNGINA